MADDEDTAGAGKLKEADMPLEARVRFHPYTTVKEVVESPQSLGGELPHEDGPASSLSNTNTLEVPTTQAPLGTRLTMTSRTGYFQDRIISPSMVSL